MGRVTTYIFAVTVLISAFLLFQVQPIIGKYILPWFGGTSFVWITSLLFFQILLLGGYLYTYIITRLSLKKQFIIHCILVLIIGIITTILFFNWNSPITPDINLKLSETYSPVLQVLGILLISVGLPYFLLSTTSTLLQKWFSVLPHNKSPYPLYALSNIGSLVAIISYPFFIEPFFSLKNQGQIWSILFILLCVLLFVCGIHMIKHKKKQSQKPLRELSAELKNVKVSWLLLPAVSSLVLLAGTHQLTQGIAPIPFLWLVPLGLYLVSFILCFSEKPFYNRNFYAYLYLGSLPIIVTFLMIPPVFGVIFVLLLYSLFLFSCFMLCHGELFAVRPQPKDLNAFYLVMSFGSVLGAAVVAIIAPLFFIGLYWEFLLGVFLTTIIALLTLLKYKNSMLYRKFSFAFTSDREIQIFFVLVTSVFFAILGANTYFNQTRDSQGIWRDFYGILQINQKKVPSGKVRCLLNGSIIHGCQPVAKKRSMMPTTYFGENSVGLAIQRIRQKEKHLRIGVIGLGVGTLAAYTKEGDYIKFYELNPLDIEIAKKHFSYLSQSPAQVETVAGDGRLSMEKELRDGNKQKYNLFVIDAFNDDAIPVHLLTKEAFELYKKHLAPNSIIAINISNRYLDLTPVIVKAADHVQMRVMFIDVPAANDVTSRSQWAFLSEKGNLLDTPSIIKAKRILTDQSDVRLWTDDYSNIYQLFKYTP